MDDSQLIKGILEGCVLAIVAQQETYGYDILLQLEAYGFENILEGTLYPILTRLEKKGEITHRSVKSPFGPMRKNYCVTAVGLHTLKEFRERYIRITSQADAILLPDNTPCRRDEPHEK